VVVVAAAAVETAMMIEGIGETRVAAKEEKAAVNAMTFEDTGMSESRQVARNLAASVQGCS